MKGTIAVFLFILLAILLYNGWHGEFNLMFIRIFTLRPDNG